jgi:hypothetical protein
LYKNKNRPKGGKQVHHFYAAPKVERPSGELLLSIYKITTELIKISFARCNSFNLDSNIG